MAHPIDFAFSFDILLCLLRAHITIRCPTANRIGFPRQWMTASDHFPDGLRSSGAKLGSWQVSTLLPHPDPLPVERMPSSDSKHDFARIWFNVSRILLVLLCGVLIGSYLRSPLPQLTYDSVAGAIDDIRARLELRPTGFLQPARHDGEGVTYLDRDQAMPGLTLISGFFDGGNELRLIRLDGSIVNRWPVSYLELLGELELPAGSITPKTDWNVDMDGALLLSDGSVLFNFEYVGTVKLDRCGELQWSVLSTHHSIEPAEAGGFWVPSRRYVETNSPLPAIPAPYYEDLIWRVSDDGVVVNELSVPDLFYLNDIQALLFANGLTDVELTGSEIVHLNDIEELSGEIADSFPLFSPGDLLLSLRELNLLMVIDPDTGELKWHQTGPWIRQHDPDFLPDGTISVFNNNTDGSTDGSVLGGSNVMQIDPVTGQVDIVYGADAGSHMYTDVRGRHQYLGDRILITEFAAGRVIEVNSSGELVWEYINRFDETTVAEVVQATRYPENFFTVSDWTCD
jgi:hypothetical protein